MIDLFPIMFPYRCIIRRQTARQSAQHWIFDVSVVALGRQKAQAFVSKPSNG
jgi:hypothetical protein